MTRASANDLSTGPALRREKAIITLAGALPGNDIDFFLQIRRSGVLDGLPFVELHNGSTLFGISRYLETRYKDLFDQLGDPFAAIGLEKVAFGAAFDGLELYHYENCFRSYLKKTDFLVEDGVVLDVGVRGAHFAVKASRLVGPGGKIVAIDPTEFAEQMTSLHVRHNNLRNVSFIRAVAAGQDGMEVDFHYGSTGEALSGLYPETLSREGNTAVPAAAHTATVSLRARTLDSIIAELGLTRCDLIVLQINGAELVALQGAEETLRHMRPALHVASYQHPSHEIDAEDPAEAIYRYVSQFGYTLACNKWGGEGILGQSLVLIPE